MDDAQVATEFRRVAECLRRWPLDVPTDLSSPHLRRLAACLTTLRQDPNAVGPADLAALIRQALRTGVEAVGERTTDTRLIVPAPADGEPWPSLERWKSHGVRAEETGTRQFRISAMPWTPSWIDHDAASRAVDDPVAEAPFESGVRRTYASVKSDMFVRDVFHASDFDFSTYSSSAHRQAVRTVVACRPGSTVFVVLPTGAGKSTVALAPALARSTPTGVSVMVVPTVALALDQERRVRSLLGTPQSNYAYTASTPDDVRRDIRTAIRDGTQQILFVSPEAISRSLSPALFHAARSGHLRYFVVDEAHLVDQWGTEFRPDFQAIAGLRSELLNTQVEAGFDGLRTVLMTATLTASTARLLEELFGRPGPVEQVVANTLRPEPAYWVAEFLGREARAKGVLEAINHLPRPAIIYSSRPARAEERYLELREAGYRRVALFTGTTDDAQRATILERFRNDDVDLVVATSAFGLGVDQDDVRTIVHACIPETIDRYYQEVGRSGRDGRASISVVCWTAGDRRDAWSFSHPRLIDERLGLERWRAMLMASEVRGDRLLLSMATLRAGLEQVSDENEKWNTRTLSLLVRAELLEVGWDVPKPAEALADRADSQTDLLPDAPDRKLVVKLRWGGIDSHVWRSRVAPVRDLVREENDRAHGLMLRALKSHAPICELFQEAYTLDDDHFLHDVPNGGRPALLCGGCPAHREGQVRGQSPEVLPLREPTPVDSSIRASDRAPVVLYTPREGGRGLERLGNEIAELLRILVNEGVSMLIATDWVMRLPTVEPLLRSLHRIADGGFFFTHFVDRFNPLELDRVPSVPTVVIAPPDHAVPREWFWPSPSDPPITLVLPDDHPAPTRPDRTVSELDPTARTLGETVRPGTL